MNGFMKGFSRFVYRFRAAILIFTALITLFLGYELATKIRINTDIISYLPDSDKAVALFNEVGSSFGSNEVAMIAVQADDIFTPGVVRDIDRITRVLKNVEGVASVTSLTDIMDIREAGDGSIETGKLIDLEAVPNPDQAALEKVREYAMSKKAYPGRIISADCKTALIAVFLNKDVKKDTAARNIRRAVEGLGINEKVYFGGPPFLTKSLSDLMLTDIRTLIPVVSVLIILTLYLSFGTLRGVIVPLVSVLLSNIWVLGFMAMCGVPMTVISTVIPVLLIAVGTAPAIHILSKFDESPEKRYGNAGEEAQGAFAEVGLRVILTSLTIIFGFTSFIFGSYLTMIREFGIFMSLGVFFALVISVMFVPALLSYIKPGEKKAGPEDGKTAAGRVLSGLSSFVMNNRVLVLAVSFAFAAAGLAGMPFIKRGFDLIDFFKPKHEAQVTDRLIQKNFGGTKPIQVVFKGDIQNPAVLKQMQKTDKFLESMEGMSNSQSVAMIIAEMESIMEGGKRIPDSREKVVNLWFLIEGQDMVSRMAASDLQSGLVQAVYGNGYNAGEMLKSMDDYVGSMDREFYPYRLTAKSPPAAREYAYSEAAETARYDLLKRDKSLKLKKEQVLAAIMQAADRGVVDVAKATDALSAMLPAEKRDRFLAEDLRGDLMQANDTDVFLPGRVYKQLPDTAAGAEPVRFDVSYTGLSLIYQHLDDSLIRSQVESFVYALIFIYLLFVMQLRSFRFGFVGLVPIVLTVLVMFGIMGFFRIPIDVATVLCGSIALGIGIDYAIHFSVRFKSYFLAGHTAGEAVAETLRTTGKAITINVVAVTMGFLTLLLAQLVPLQRLAILIASAMIGSGLGALTTLPAMLSGTNPGFLGKLEKRKGETK